MFNPNPPKSSLHNLLSQTFSQEKRSRSTARSQQSDNNVSRLKNICFPRNDENNPNQTIDHPGFTIRHDHSRYPPARPRQRITVSSHINKSPNVDKSSSFYFQDQTSFVAYNTSDVSFNMSPLSARHENQEVEHDTSGWFEGEKSDIMNRVRKDLMQTTMTPSKTPLKEISNIHQKSLATRDHVIELAQHFNSEMTRFVSTLMKSMKNICMTKTSERSLQVLLEKYSGYLGGVQDEWDQNLHSEEDFNEITKNLVKTLGNCFAELLNKLSDLLHKLKNFKGIDFNPLATKGVLSTLAIILQQDNTLTSHQALLQGLQILTQHTNGLVAMRLAYFFKSKLASQKLHAFTAIKLHVARDSIQQSGASSISAGSVLFNLMQQFYLKQLFSSFSHLKTNYISQTLKQEINNQESLKDLLTSLLKSAHNEAQFFEAINFFLANLTKCGYCEFLLLDKSQHIAYGYPSQVNTSESIENKPLQSKRMYKSRESSDKDTLVTFYDSVPSLREDEPMKYELSYDNESLLHYVISTKQALESWNLPHISLYNRDIDIPFGAKKVEKFSKFIYYPICSKTGEKEVTAVIRLFLSEKEGPLNQYHIDSLQRFSQTMGPLLNTFINLLKKASSSNTDRLLGGDVQEEVFKKLIGGLVKMMNLSDTTDIFQTFSQLLFSLIYIEGFSIFQWNHDGSLGKLYSSDSHIVSSGKEQNPTNVESSRQLKTANSLQISIVDPSTGNLKGLIEIQRSKYEGIMMKGKKKDATTAEKFFVDSLPSTLTTLISTFGFHVIEKIKSLQDEEAERRALEGQVEEVKSINTFLGNRLNLHELLHEFTGKLQNCSSHTEVVLLFNDILQKSRVQIDLATLCFTNSNNTGYFTYNHLYDEHLETLTKRSIVNYTENLVSFSKVDSLLGSLLNSISQENQIIRINYEQQTSRPAEPGVLKINLDHSDRHKGIYLDLQDEDILSQFPIKTHESFSNSNEHGQRCPKKMLLLPISDHNGNIVAHIVLGQSSNTKVFDKDEEFFAEKLGEILKDYLSSQQKLSNSLNEILREVEKNQANQSKIKAYRGLVLNQNLQPEYQTYKKHKNLQAFILFLEATYCQLLKAQTSRVLLYDENSDALYHYPKIQSSEIKEITHKLASSITGNCVLKNDHLIYPVPAASPYALSINDNAISPLASHRIATWRSKISNTGGGESSAPKKDLKLKTPFKERLQNLGGFAFHHHEATGWPSSSRSQLFHTPGRPSSFLSQHPQYNPQVDHVDKIQFTKPIGKQSFGMKQNKTEATSSSDMVNSFLCVPLCDDSKRVIGVLQLFNKSQPGKHFQTKDLIKVNAITEAMLPKLVKLINNPEKLTSKGFTTGFDKIVNTFNNYQTDKTRDSFLNMKNIYLNHRKHKTRGLYVYAGLNLVSSIFNSNVKRYFDQIKLFDTITRLEVLHKENLQHSSRKERLAGLNSVMEKLVWKNKSNGFNSIKLSSYEDLSMLISSQYTRGGDTFKGKGLLLGGDVSIQAKYFAKTLCGVLQNKISAQKKSAFEDLRQHTKTQKALMLLDSQRSGPKSLKSFLSMMTTFIKRMYSEGFLQCNIALVDTMAEKAFWFNEKSTPEFHIGIKNRKQLKNFEKIVQQRLTHTSDAMSVFDTDDGEDFEQVSYIAIDLSDSPLFEATFDDPNLIIEVLYKGSDSIEITENQKDQIHGLFVQGISNLKGTLNVMFNLQKKFSTNTKYKSFMKWMLATKEQKNNEVIGQTARAFQLVETQMATFEQDMKKYQEEIVAYDERFKILTADLDSKTELNTELNFKIEQLTVEKKAKTKCLALSMMFTLFSTNTSLQFKLRANFDKWRNMAKTARVTTNIVSKISKINHKHISARYRASILILTHVLQKCSQKVLMTSFKQLVASSVMLFTLQKSAIIPHSLSHNASLQDIREEVRSKTPEAATRKSLNSLKVPYLPLKRDTASMHPIEREFWAEKKKEEDKEFNTTLHLEMPSQLNISGFSQGSNEGIAPHDRLVGTGSSIVARYGRKSSMGSRENLDNDNLSRSPKHLSFIHYRTNLMEKGSGKKNGKKPEMSERTVNFLKEFEANKYLNQRKNKGDALNKSDIASSTRKSKYNRDSGNQTFHYNRPTNSSFVTNENLGESFSLKNTEDFFKKSK